MLRREDMVEESSSEFLKHIPCEKCGSSDANSLYTDGHQHCFACNNHISNGDHEVTEMHIEAGFVAGDIKDLPKRSITLETTRKFGYRVGKYAGKPVQIANYTDEEGNVVAQKLRFPDKTFRVVGNSKEMTLFGQNIWGHRGGKMVVVCEGEIDAMSVSQVQGNRWATVSIPNGAQSAKKAVQKSFDWLSKFEKIVFCFDQDEQGQKAAKECASLFPKAAHITSLPRKDANEMLVHGEVKELVDALWSARPFRPDGIVKAEDMWDRLSNQKAVQSFQIPFETLNKKLGGIRKQEILTVVAGSGIGKSQICRELSYSLMQQGQKIGYLALEESVERTLLGFMSITANRRLHMETETNKDDLKRIFDETFAKDRLVLYDHFGSLESENLLDRIRYMVRVDNCDFIVLDHLSVVVSGISEDASSDERRLIDNTMTKLRMLVQELGCGMILVNHLKRPAGNRGHEDGEMTSLSHIRGSAAVGQLSDAVLGAERNHHGENPNVTTLRVLKARFTGDTGEAGQITYDPDTGRLLDKPIEFDEFEDTTDNRDF